MTGAGAGAASALLAVATFVIGVVMLARTIALGGGPFDLGILLGALFVLAGGLRLYVLVRARNL